MKKIIIMLLIAISLCACSDKKEEPPVENNPVPPQTQPVPSSNEPDEKEYTYQLEKQWIVYDFELLHAKQTYEIKDGLILKLVGKNGSAPYCQNDPCILYDEVMVNDKDIALLENMELKINSDYGTLTMYNLNDELYLLNFNFAAMNNSCTGIVFSDDGELIMTYEESDLSMNEIYQNQFALSHTNTDGSSTFDIYTAEGKTLEHSTM
jgi:hypothetical protein